MAVLVQLPWPWPCRRAAVAPVAVQSENFTTNVGPIRGGNERVGLEGAAQGW